MKVEPKQYLLLLDALRIPDAKKILAKENREWLPLYLGSVWEPQIENSPICIMLDQDDAIWQVWQANSLWASSGVVFEYDETCTQKEMIASLQNNITIKSEDGRLFLLRFYSPHTMSLIVKHGNESVVNSILGIASAVHLSNAALSDDEVGLIKNTVNKPSVESAVVSNEFMKELLG